MSKNYYPQADTKTQDFSKKYAGSKMEPNCLVWHTTEGYSFPSNAIYRNGGTAPHMTVRPNIAARTITARAHGPANRSARALENRAGGVETNTLNVFQVELVGTCDPKYRKTWGNLKAGIDYIYWPDAPDWLLELIADIPRWLASEWSGFRIEDGAPRGWLAYPSSYGNTNRQRMTNAEWNACYGMVGHQHVPENSHGDPGNLKIAKIVAFAKGAAPAPSPSPSPDFTDPNLYPPTGSAHGNHITWLGERLVAHLTAADIPVPYAVGPGPGWSETDREAVRLFQEGQGWTGADADGYPGPVTLARLADDPAKWPAVGVPTPEPDPEPEPEESETRYTVVKGDTLYAISQRTGVSVEDLARWNGLGDVDVIREGQTLTLIEPDAVPPVCPVPDPVDPSEPPKTTLVDETVVFWNMAGYNAAHGKASATKRIPGMAASMLADDPDVIICVELSHAMLAPMDKALPGYTRALLPGKTATSSNGAGREVYLRNGSKALEVVKENVDTMLNGDDKPMLGVVYEPPGGGRPRVAVAAHNEHENNTVDKKTGLHADTIRVRQLRENLAFAIHRLADRHDVLYASVVVGVDTNSYSWALAEANLMNWRSSYQLAEESENGEYKTHNNWKAFELGGQFDLVLVRHNAVIKSVTQALDASLSDHHKITVVRQVRA